MILSAFFGLLSAATAEADERAVNSIRWTEQRTSVADLAIGHTPTFEHSRPGLTAVEQDAYAALIAAIEERRLRAGSEFVGDALVNQWEMSFYRFEEVRRKAWENGMVLLNPSVGVGSAAGSSAPEAFRQLELQAGRGSGPKYSLRADMLSHPHDFVGRPVVMYGVFEPSGEDELPVRNALEGDPVRIRLLRGMLKSLSGDELVAVVDTAGYIGPGRQGETSNVWSSSTSAHVPVIVKGWFIKLWGQRPLIYTEAVQILSPEPFRQRIRQFADSLRPVQGDETWLYYETLRRLQLTDPAGQQRIAAGFQQERISELMEDVRREIRRRKTEADEQLSIGRLTESDHRMQTSQLERQLRLRLDRYAEYSGAPSEFPVFVDLFRNPDRWQGALVTMTGHVRRVVTYPSDDTMFNGQLLHELWLFTDDSQNNPTVVVTPSLPDDFPETADVLDNVSVTGCFFKMYVYKSEGGSRKAPLLLAGTVNWVPTADEVLRLADAGQLPAGSPRVVAARQMNPDRPSEMLILIVGFGCVIVMMVIWGRVQRDRMERRRMLERVDSSPNFAETFPDPLAQRLSRYQSE